MSCILQPKENETFKISQWIFPWTNGELRDTHVKINFLLRYLQNDYKTHTRMLHFFHILSKQRISNILISSFLGKYLLSAISTQWDSVFRNFKI